MRICFVEDKAASDLEPLSLTRPVFDLMLGATTVAQKIARAFGVGGRPARCGMVVRAHLEALQRARTPQACVNDAAWLARGPTVVVNGRWIPPEPFPIPPGDSPWVGLCDGAPACAFVNAGQAAGLGPNEVDGWFAALASTADCREVGGEWVCRPWDLVVKNPDHLIRDFEATPRIGPTPRHLSAAALIGSPGCLSIHELAQIDPYTVFDTTNGPITIDAGVVVRPFTRIEGPCYVGPRTQLFSAEIRGGVTLGACCRIGGEVEQSIVHGYTNKYHEGFVGHSYIGEWVNVGAISSTSDLRNDYGEVFIDSGGDPIPTAQTKVGSFLGDHTRMGIGCMLNTGTTVGVMCNLLPAGRLLPRHVPSFTTVAHGRVAPGVDVERLFETARIVKSRRGEAFSPREEELFLDLYARTRLERERACQWVREKIGDRELVAHLPLFHSL
jgi:UDP-N-acetylglucosamine diphosphorylase/glucosamine-1-phosphate N-acetyltransferase